MTTAALPHQDRSSARDQIVRAIEELEIGVVKCHPKLQLDVADQCEALEWIKLPQPIMWSREYSEALEEGEKHSIGGDHVRLAAPGNAE